MFMGIQTCLLFKLVYCYIFSIYGYVDAKTMNMKNIMQGRINFARCIMIGLWCAPLLIIGQELPEMPGEWIETCVPLTNNEITVCAFGCDYANNQLQQALNSAVPGTTILLEQGATYTGPYNLPEKVGDGWIVIRTALADELLPGPNQRIDPSFAPILAKVAAKPGLSAFQTTGRAHNYYFLGLEIAAIGFSWNVIAIGNGEDTLEELPHDFTFDRVYVHGHPALGSRRGIAMNGRRIAVVNSWISDFKEVGFDSQALCAWNGTTFKIVNNYLEGSGENVMFGGAKPNIANLLCSDIEVRHNHFRKPLSWRVGDPTYEGTHWTVKNLFELKNADRIWIEGNIFENNWADAQTGFAILFTPRTEGGSCPWITVQNVTFERNIIRHIGGGFNISGRDGNFSNVQANHFLIKNNLIEDVDGNKWGGDGRALQVISGVHHLTVDHNTFVNPLGGTFINADGPNFPNEHFVYQNNIASNAKYGLHGSGKGIGNPALNFYFPNAVFTHNVLTDGTASNGGVASNYPAGNFFPGPMVNFDFVSYQNANYKLLPGSPFSGAGTDGKDMGADIKALNVAIEGVVNGAGYGCTSDPTSVRPVISTADHNVHVFPNPGKNHVFVDSLPNADSEITLWDIQGKLLPNLPSQVDKNGWIIDTSTLPPGLYYFRIVYNHKVITFPWICLNE